MAREENLEWNDIDTSSFKGKIAATYKAYKEAQKAAAEKRVAFEDMLRASLVSGEHVSEDDNVLIAHRFGKVAFAVSSQPKPEKRAKRQAVSL